MAHVIKQLKRAPLRLSLARRCFIMTGPKKSIPVELNGGFMGSNLAKGRSLIFGGMFLRPFSLAKNASYTDLLYY